MHIVITVCYDKRSNPTPKGVMDVYRVVIELQLKKNLPLKSVYERVAIFLRTFIEQNNKGLKATHYDKNFSYYSFSNFFPREPDAVFKKGKSYQVEIRSLHAEFLDLKHFKGMETPEMTLVGVNGGKLFYRGTGTLKSETPVFFNTKRIETAAYEADVKARIQENVLYRYVKSGQNQSDDLDHLRAHVIQDIHINRNVITIPFETKKLNNGRSLLYHCLHIDLAFQDNDIAREAERIIYAGGLGLNTSNGFGLMKSEGL